MSANTVTDLRREDVLREFNLYPLWQLRVAASANEPTAEEAEITPVQDEMKPEQITSRQAVAIVNNEPDCSDLGWAELKKRVKACTACKLRAGCMQTVFGMGDEKADWLFVGSWPNEDDEASGNPFAGQAGQLLDNMLAAIKLQRGVNVYLANIVKCSGSIQQAPQKDEIAQCIPYLARQIQLLQPKIIVALGHAAAANLLGEDRDWSSQPGKVHDYVCHAKDGSQQTTPLVITHHPAALLLAPLNKAQTWRDLCLARDTLLHLQAEDGRTQ